MRNFLIATTAIVGLAFGAVGAQAQERTYQENKTVGNGAINFATSYANGPQTNAFGDNADNAVEGVGAVNSVNQKNVHGEDQVNRARSNFAYNEGDTTATGTQTNDAGTATLVFGAPRRFGGSVSFVVNAPEMDKATQSVVGVGAQNTVGQRNKTATSDQDNYAVNNTAVNTGVTNAVGNQFNTRVLTAKNNVGATGALNSVDQVNRDSDDDQGSVARNNSATNFGDTFATGYQHNGNLLTSEELARNTVNATGAVGLVSQTNREGSNNNSTPNGANQINRAVGNSAVNHAGTYATGTQINTGVAKARQTVGAVGASQNVTQRNID